MASASEQQQALITLGLAPGLGNVACSALLQRCGSPQAVLDFIVSGAPLASLQTTTSVGDDSSEDSNPLAIRGLEAAISKARSWCKRPQGERWQCHLDWLQQPDHHLLHIHGDDYPQLLTDIQRPPWLLFAVGNVDLLWQPQVAVVGSRNPSNHGLQQTQEITAALSHAGLTITSGLADGIDAAAHRAALQASGNTIAVMGTGVDRIYPACNRDLGREIAASGLLLSEFALGTEPRAGHFPARNRIISGLALATVVVEAGLRSGSLITARLASEQGREVMAMPGSVRNATSRGCHALIRDGARLVENAEQVLTDIAPLAGQLAASLQVPASAVAADPDAAHEQKQQAPAAALDSDRLGPDIALDEDYHLLWRTLSHDPMTIDELVGHTGLTPESISSMLLLLELHGKVSTEAAGWVRDPAASHEVIE
jgi:DNA processing protein